MAEALHRRHRQRLEDRAVAQQQVGAGGDRRADLVGAQPRPAEEDEDRHQRRRGRSARRASPAARRAAIAQIEPSAIAASLPACRRVRRRPIVSSSPSRWVSVFAATSTKTKPIADREPARVGVDRVRARAPGTTAATPITRLPPAIAITSRPRSSSSTRPAPPSDRAELPGRLEEADVAVGQLEHVERQADDDHLGEALEEEQRRGRHPGQPQGRMGGEGAEAGGDLARRAGELTGLRRGRRAGGRAAPRGGGRRRSATATAQTPKRKAGEVAVSRKPAPIAPSRLPRVLHHRVVDVRRPRAAAASAPASATSRTRPARSPPRRSRRGRGRRRRPRSGRRAPPPPSRRPGPPPSRRRSSTSTSRRE